MIFAKLFRPNNLWSAAKKGDVAVIERLVAAGHDVNAKKQAECVEGATPLHVAALSGREDAIKVLVKLNAQINAKDDDGRTALMAAVCSSQGPEIVELFLKLGANINAQDKEGMTALDYAASAGSVQLVSMLIRLGASPNVGKGAKKSSPVVHGIEGGNLEVLKILLAAKADVNTPHSGWSPLSKAALGRRADFVNLLLAAGANVEQKDEAPSGRTPLLSAVAGGSLEVVRMLIEAGTNANAANAYTGESALDVAESPPRNAEIAEYLRSVGAKHAKELPKKESEGDEESGTSWQLQDNSMLDARIEPWPPTHGKATLKVEISSEPELAGGWNVEYRIRSQSNRAQDWSRMFSAANKGDSDDEQFEAEIVLEPGTRVVEFKVSGRMHEKPDVLSDWIITIT